MDKADFYAYGTAKERLFVRMIAPKYGLSAEIHPAKESDKYHPDLLVDGKIADLKAKEEPFFMALDMFKIDPQYCVSFDVHDMERYAKLFPEIEIYFWVNWSVVVKEFRGWTYRVDQVNSVWVGTLDEINQHHVAVHKRKALPAESSHEEGMILDVRKLRELQRV